MVQISRQKPNREIEERIWEIFLSSLSQTQTLKEIAELVDDLLTPTEKIVLSKRMAIALMCIKGYDSAMIKDTLKVSGGTVSQIKSWLVRGGQGYKRAVDKILKQEEIEKFLDQVNEFLYRLGYAKRLFEPNVLTSKQHSKRRVRKLI
jgi:uncharacterized protein YerC